MPLIFHSVYPQVEYFEFTELLPPHEQIGLENNSSTSSNFFPLVSGTVMIMNTKPIVTIPTNSQ